jgi:hypothetical protein
MCSPHVAGGTSAIGTSIKTVSGVLLSFFRLSASALQIHSPTVPVVHCNRRSIRLLVPGRLPSSRAQAEGHGGHGRQRGCLQNADPAHRAGDDRLIGGVEIVVRLGSLLKNAVVALFNLARCGAKLHTARKITTYVAILSSHPCDVAAC